jgi:polyphosphate glucokinase
MEIRGRDAERRSAAAARLRRGISWKAWAADLDEHLLAIERLFSPRLFIIGGGVSKRADQFVPRLTVRARVVPARLRNDAGIVGAAMAAAETESGRAG